MGIFRESYNANLYYKTSAIQTWILIDLFDLVRARNATQCYAMQYKAAKQCNTAG